eukprot:scaffold4431_cov69-Skeletonema_dohrnii-CCMP3373.AAC.3
MVVSSQRLKHCYDADIKVEAPLPKSKEDGMQYNQLRGISNRMTRTGWVSQLASRQNMIGADSYAGVVSAARVTSKRC